MNSCECMTKKGEKCKNKTVEGSTMCHVHLKNPFSKKVVSRFSTLMHAISEDISKRLPFFKIECDESVCYYCKEKLTLYTRTRDHIVNLVEKSWFNKLTNLTNATVPCCRGCNQKKGKKHIEHPFPITDEYVFEKEEELKQLVNQLKDTIYKIHDVISTSKITRREIEKNNFN